MKMNNTVFYQIGFTLDKKIRGRYEMPHTIDLNKELIEYKRQKCKNVWQYFENIDTIYNEMPNNLTGKLYKRKDVVDIMDSSPYFLSLDYVITEKVKTILEELCIDRSEYILKEIRVENFNEKFYLMFIPIQRIENLIDFKNSFFKCGDNVVSFNSYSEYFEEVSVCVPKKILIPKEYAEKDIFNLQGCDVFFSERVISRFKTYNVSGYDIEEGYFKTDLEFY
jgi:hypothetical protein